MMWELIRANRRKSILLFLLMGCCLLSLGYLIGATWFPPRGGSIGLTIALVVWVSLSYVSYFSGSSILLSLAQAKTVTPSVHPRLFNVVEEMKIAAGLPALPKVYLIDSPALNAFATGNRPEESSIAVTTGLLSKLNRDELQGVVAHETSHILNRDSQFMTFAGLMLGSIVLISEIFLRGLWYGGGSSRRFRGGSSRGGGQAGAILAILALVFAILAPVFARLLYFAISRRREYLADASAARLTRYPEGLAGALEKIDASPEVLNVANKATAALYIANPFKKEGSELSDWSSTHPPLSERVRILRSMTQGAGLNHYQEAFNHLRGKASPLIPASGLKQKGDVPLRPPGLDEPPPAGQANQTRDLNDLVRAVNQFKFVPCLCGLKIKIPPDFKRTAFACPGCGREIKIPAAELTTLTAAAGFISSEIKPSAEPPVLQTQLIYRRKGGWETFACTCGQTQQLAPNFAGKRLTCSGCGREIIVQ
jgi:heat shock protein HtpX